MNGKKVLVTGADGFIGSHLVEALIKKGAEVRALAFYNSFHHLGWLEDVKNVEVVTGDIRDPQTCRRITKGIDTVFHLAALIGIPYSYIAPESYLQTNLMGTANLCQAALDNHVQRFIHTSTSEVYGTADYIPMDENHPLKPQSPYSASKIGADSIALSYHFSFDLPLTIARPFNNYGPRQSTRAIIPSLITQIGSGKNKILIGNCAPTRDFVFVEDTCEAMIQLATSERTIGETLNIGTGVEISIGEIAKRLGELFDQEIELVQDSKRMRTSKSEVFRLCCNADKLEKLTSYRPTTSLDEGLRKTIAWFSENAHRYKTSFHV